MTLPRNVEDGYPLSPMQHLMLLHAVSSSGNGVLLNQVCYDIRGVLDAEAFRCAWDALVARHAALRTCVLWEGLQRPLQIVRSSVSLPYNSIDLTESNEDDRAKALEALRREDFDAPMPLARAPLMRCTMARLAPEHHRFIWSVHHLAVDRWSHGVLFADLRALYEAYTLGEPSRLEPPAQFRDYIAWATAQDRAAAERFWRDDLAGIREPTLLARPDGALRRGARLTTTRRLSRDVTTSLRDRAARWRTTPGALLLSAAGLVIARRTGREDVVHGVTVSGRPAQLPGADSAVGSFMTNLPARLTVRPAQRLDDLVREVQRGQLRRESFAHVSLGDIHGWSGVAPGRALFDTLVLLNLSDDVAVHWPGIEMVVQSATLDAAYPLVLAFGIESDRLVVTLVHDASFENPDGLATEIESQVARLAAADDSSLVRDVYPEADGSDAASVSPTASPNGERARRSLPGAPLSEMLLDSWRDVLGIENVSLDDDFFVLGGSSLQAAQLFARIERVTGKTLPLSTLIAAGSVRALVAEIDRPVPRAGSLVHMRSSGERPPLYVVPGIGGNIVGLAGLARELGPQQPFHAFESPGLDGREPPLATIEAIAERYADELAREEARPFHLLGICWGATVAFEMARALAARGRRAASIVMLDPAALLRDATPRGGRAEVTFLRERLEMYWDALREGDWQDRTRMLARKATRAARVLVSGDERARTQGELNQVRVEDANREAVIRYVPRAIDARALMLVTRDRDLRGGPDPRLEWLTLVDPRPELAWIDGVDSADAISPAKVRDFAHALTSWLHSVPDAPR